MSAIFGHVGVAPHGTAERMADRLVHRAGEPVVRDLPGGGFLGAMTGRPDMAVFTDDRLALVCSATIYGAELRTGASAERLARCLDEGGSAFDALDADFALGAVGTDGTVTLGRDFFGCAPLYFAQTPSGLAFSSEYKAILAIEGFEPEPDREMLQALQHGKRLPLGRTLFGSIESVLPGSILTISPGGARTVHTAPGLEVTGEITGVPEAKELIRERLVEAVHRRAGDLDTIGLALSGGIDSIALAFMFHEFFPGKRLVTVSAGSSPDDHECVTARAVAEAVGSEHHEVITRPGDLSLRAMSDLVWHLEDPYSRSEALQLYEVGRTAAEVGCTVLFSAQGADGLFAGMPKYKLLRLMERFAPARRGLGEFYNYTQLGLEPNTVIGRLGVLAKFRGAVPPVPRVCETGFRPEPATFPVPGPQFINRTMARGFQAGVCQDIQKFERGFAAHGVAYRSPFYDMALVRAAYTIDDALKIRVGQEKWIFRKTLAEWVPDEFLDIPKFPQRIGSTHEFADALDRIARVVLFDESAASPFDTDSIVRLLRINASKPYAYEAAMRLWTAVLTQIWFERFTAVAVERAADAVATAEGADGG